MQHAVTAGSCAPGGRQVYLTFDDGPDPRWTTRVLDLLAGADARATFFVIGRLARAEAPLLRRIARLGHEIGNHTWSHRHPWTMSARLARQDVRDGAEVIADIVGRRPRLFRPPHGRVRRCMLEEARAGGQRLVLWSVSAVDWGPLGRARRIAARLSRVLPEDIVLMHDGGRGVNRPSELVQVLPAFLAALGRDGVAPCVLPGSHEAKGHGATYPGHAWIR